MEHVRRRAEGNVKERGARPVDRYDPWRSGSMGVTNASLLRCGFCH